VIIIGEHIAETAQREVFEETGIKSKFLGILAFRHMHGFRYGCSDFYFSCLMKAESNVIKKCDQEISKCAWIKASFQFFMAITSIACVTLEMVCFLFCVFDKFSCLGLNGEVFFSVPNSLSL